MKIHPVTFLFSLTVILILDSCVTNKQLTYLRDSGKFDTATMPGSDLMLSVTPAIYKIMPFDNLYIRVITPDPQWSALFNIMPVGAGGSVTEESAALFGYPVDAEGKIEIPFVGKVEVGNKTLSEIKTELEANFKNYLTDASITVRLVNNYVSILGEVNAPGRYRLTKDRVNIFEALSLAGDMSDFSNRQKLELIRPSPYGPIVRELSLSDRSILSSEFYYVMPNDIIYAVPMKGRSFRVNSTVWTIFLTTITSALGVIGFFRTL